MQGGEDRRAGEARPAEARWQDRGPDPRSHAGNAPTQLAAAQERPITTPEHHSRLHQVGSIIPSIPSVSSILNLPLKFFNEFNIIYPTSCGGWIGCSLLVLRQTLISQSAAPPPPADLDTAVSLAAGRLFELVERDPHVGVPEIVAAALGAAPPPPPERDGRREREEVMAGVLYRSLQAGDPVFGKVSGAVYLAARGLVLAGCGARGRRVAAAALQRVGGTVLLDRLADTAGSLGTMATVSCQVHRPWYVALA